MAACTQGMGAALRRSQQNEPKHLETKKIFILLLKGPRVLLPHLEAKEENLKILFLLSLFLPLSSSSSHVTQKP